MHLRGLPGHLEALWQEANLDGRRTPSFYFVFILYSFLRISLERISTLAFLHTGQRQSQRVRPSRDCRARENVFFFYLPRVSSVVSMGRSNEIYAMGRREEISAESDH